MIPVFIIASERSGTNLLRTLLGNHHSVVAPVAPHFLDTFYPISHYYGSLSIQKNVLRLIKDGIALANHPYHNWQLEVTANELYEKYHPRSLVSVVDSLYKEQALAQGKTQAYVSKGIHNFNYVSLVKNELPNAKFIYLFRDPRDKVASLLRTPLFQHTAFQIASRWNIEQQKCLNAASVYENDIYSVQYESLIKNTEHIMSEMLNFLELEIDQSCFNTNTENKEANRNEFWKNLNKPILKNNDKKYKNQLSDKQVLIIESTAEETMRILGYSDFDTTADWKEERTYTFKLQELFKTYFSKKKHKSLYVKKMAELKDKIDFIKKIKTNIKTEYLNDTSNQTIFASKKGISKIY